MEVLIGAGIGAFLGLLFFAEGGGEMAISGIFIGAFLGFLGGIGYLLGGGLIIGIVIGIVFFIVY